MFWLLAVVPSLAHGAPVSTDVEAPGNPALAHDLFDQGRALMAQGDYHRACRKFEESRRADGGGGGGGTLLNLALCHELAGNTGTAWALFRTARSLAIRDRREDRKSFAEEHIAQLSPRLLRLRVIIPAQARFPGLVVHRNGIPLSEGEWGEALIVDPGEHSIEVRAPARRPFRITIRMHGEGASRDVTVPVLGPAALPSGSGPLTLRDRDRRVAATLVGGVGLATVAVGGVFALRSQRRHDQADALCPDYDHCDPAGISLSSDAASDARVALSTLIGGTIVLAAGIVLYVTAPATTVPNRSGVSAPSAPRFEF